MSRDSWSQKSVHTSQSYGNNELLCRNVFFRVNMLLVHVSVHSNINFIPYKVIDSYYLDWNWVETAPETDTDCTQGSQNHDLTY